MKIDIVIPTMWVDPEISERILKYAESDSINKIFVVDNNKKRRPKLKLNDKIEIISYGRNIYVNPAWNEGYYRSTQPVICFLNDDITVENELFSYIASLDFDDIDIIGVHLKGSVDNYHIVEHPDRKEQLIKLDLDKSKPIGGQAYAFGVCLFVKRTSYYPIPSLYQIWYGDDYLVQRNNNIWALKTSKITGEISKTIVTGTKNKSSDIQKRLDLDSINAYKYNHFLNGKNWDLLKNAYLQHKQDNVDIFEQEYLTAVSTPSDINENLHILHDLADECNTVVEMGVRTGVSTRAFLAKENIKLRSYDIVLNNRVAELFEHAKTLGRDVQYIKADVRKLAIDDCDLLFIDTLHTYDQLKMELNLHAEKAKKYIVLHDTYTFGLIGEDRMDKKGLISAVIEFMIEHPEWKFKVWKTNNNGLTVLERT